MKTFFIAAIVPEKAEEGGGYSVYFPDVPEAVTGGATIEEAIFMAEDVLRMVLQDLASEKKEIPVPSSLEVVQEKTRGTRREDGLDYPENTLYQYVAAPSLDMVPVKITVSLPKAVLEETDRKARAFGFTRSGFLAHAVHNYDPHMNE